MTSATEKPGWLDRQRAHFEAGALRYQKLYGDSTPFHDAMTQRLLELADLRPGLKVLDLGCGPGRTTVPLLRAGCEVTGLDLSEKSQALLSSRIQDLGLDAGFTARTGPAEGLEDHRAFDRVIARGLLHHLEKPAPVLERVRRALRPGGRLVLMDPNPGQPLWAALITLHPSLSWPIEQHLYRHTARFNRALLTAAGLEKIEIDYLGLVPPPAWGLPMELGDLEDRLRRVPGLRRLALYMVSRATRSGPQDHPG